MDKIKYQKYINSYLFFSLGAFVLMIATRLFGLYFNFSISVSNTIQQIIFYLTALFPINFIAQQIFNNIYGLIGISTRISTTISEVVFLLVGVAGYLYLLKNKNEITRMKVLFVATVISVFLYLSDLFVYFFIYTDISRMTFLMFYGFSRFVGLFFSSILLFIFLNMRGEKNDKK